MRTIFGYFGWNSERIPNDIEELANYADKNVMLSNHFTNAVEWIQKDLIAELSKQKQPCNHIGCYNHETHPCEGCGRILGQIPPAILNGIIKTINEIK